MRKFAVGCLVAALGVLGSTVARAEVNELKLMSQFGIGYMQLTVMKQRNSSRSTWPRPGSDHQGDLGHARRRCRRQRRTARPAACTSPLAARGRRSSCGTAPRAMPRCTALPRCPPARTCWSRATRTSRRCATSPRRTASRWPARAPRCTRPGCRWRWPRNSARRTTRSSIPLMVNLPHPEGLRAMLSGSAEITVAVHLDAVPEPGAGECRATRIVLNSYDVMGGPNTFAHGVVDQEVPRREPEELQGLRRRAARRPPTSSTPTRSAPPRCTCGEGGGKENVDKLLRAHQRSAGALHHGAGPHAAVRAVHAPGRHHSRTVPTVWKDLFFPEVHDLPGS